MLSTALDEDSRLCCGCHERPARPRANYCKGCAAKASQRYYDRHRATIARRRQAHLYTPATLAVRRARAYLGVLLSRGKISREPCETCGEAHVRPFQPDPSTPRLVRWFCVRHRAKAIAQIEYTAAEEEAEERQGRVIVARSDWTWEQRFVRAMDLATEHLGEAYVRLLTVMAQRRGDIGVDAPEYRERFAILVEQRFGPPSGPAASAYRVFDPGASASLACRVDAGRHGGEVSEQAAT